MRNPRFCRPFVFVTCFAAALLILRRTIPLRGEQNDQNSKPLFEEQPLFRAKDAGYHCYRIPALWSPGTEPCLHSPRRGKTAAAMLATSTSC